VLFCGPSDISWRKSSGLATTIKRIWDSLPDTTNYTLSANSLIEMYFSRRKADAAPMKRKRAAATDTKLPKRKRTNAPLSIYPDRIGETLAYSVPRLQDATIARPSNLQQSDERLDYLLDARQSKRRLAIPDLLDVSSAGTAIGPIATGPESMNDFPVSTSSNALGISL
jgi:hypothetical protein